MLWEIYFDVTYRIAPKSYLAVAHHLCTKCNPQFMAEWREAYDGLDGLPYGWWPLILFRQGRQYVEKGGRETYPRQPKALDTLLRHVAQQGECPGPIRTTLIALRHLAAITFSEGDPQAYLERTLAPLLNRYPRMKGVMELQDLVQEAVAAFTEVIKDPAITWKEPGSTWAVGERWATSTIRPTPAFVRRVIERLVGRKYGVDRQLERLSVPLVQDEPVPEDSVERMNWRSDSIEWRSYLMSPGKENVEARLDAVMESLSPKTREAVEVRHQAIIAGKSLKEMALELGHDPAKIRELFKAVQRRYR